MQHDVIIGERRADDRPGPTSGRGVHAGRLRVKMISVEGVQHVPLPSKALPPCPAAIQRAGLLFAPWPNLWDAVLLPT